jgi:hypothetical protein
MLREFSDTVPFLLAENHATEASRVTSRLVDMTLGRMVEMSTWFTISLTGETPTPMVLNSDSQTVVTVFGKHCTQYQRCLRVAANIHGQCQHPVMETRQPRILRGQ